MQSLINWTYGNCPYNEGKYLILVKLPGGGHKISVDCYGSDGLWEVHSQLSVDAYCSFDDIKPLGSTYLFDEKSHQINNKTLRDFHLDITEAFCDDIRDNKDIATPSVNKHFVFLDIWSEYIREEYGVKFEPHKLQFVELKNKS